MKTSLRTILISVFFCASCFAHAVAFDDGGNHSVISRLTTAVVSFVAMQIGASAACASIAFDRSRTRRSAERAAVIGFTGFSALGILISIALTPRVN